MTLTQSTSDSCDFHSPADRADELRTWQCDTVVDADDDVTVVTATMFGATMMAGGRFSMGGELVDPMELLL